MENQPAKTAVSNPQVSKPSVADAGMAQTNLESWNSGSNQIFPILVNIIPVYAFDKQEIHYSSL